MSSVFSRKITMSTFSGVFTGLGTPVNQRTGRRHTYRSRSWRRATLRLRMPPPTGVVSGPLMPMRCDWKVSTVSWGSQSPVSLKAFSPARTSSQSMRLPCLEAAASRTFCAAGQMSTPVPSPSMNGVVGSSGTESAPSSAIVIFGIGARLRGGLPRSQSEGGVDLPRRLREVQRVEVDPGHPGLEERRGQLDGLLHADAAHLVRVVGHRLELLGEVPGEVGA